MTSDIKRHIANMNIRDLKYLVALADHRHFGNAAEACFVSQPALSMQIKKLEEVLGVQLIERTSKSVRLTEIGHSLTQHAREILHRVEMMKEVAKQSKDPLSGEFQLGIIPTLAPYLIPHIIPSLLKTFPKLTIYLIEEQTANLVNKLRHGKLDAAILGLPLPNHDFITTPLFEEEFLLALPSNHALSKRKHIHLTDLENSALLLLDDGHCMRDFALELCYRAKASEAKGFQATSLETLRHMVACQVGMTLMPKLSYKANDGVCYVSFNPPKPARIVGMAWRSSSAKKILLTKMVDEIRKLMKKEKAVRVIESSSLLHRSSRKRTKLI